MPSKKPTLMLRMTEQEYDLITRMAKIQGTSRAAVMMEFWQTVVPVLERVVVAAEAAQRIEIQAREGLVASLERAEATIAPLAEVAAGQLDWVVRDARNAAGSLPPATRSGPMRAERSESRTDRSRAGRSPRPVIRGPGRGAGSTRKPPRKGVRS